MTKLLMIFLAATFLSQTALGQEGEKASGVIVEVKKDDLSRLRGLDRFNDLKIEYLLEEVSYDEGQGLLKLDSILDIDDVNEEDFIAFCYLVEQLEVVSSCYPNHLN